jgi:hypothetical protein
MLHTSTLLADGRVLVTGGKSDSGVVSTAAIYDPERNTWARAASMHDRRYAHDALLLADGRVIVVGGMGAGLFASRGGDLHDPYLDTAEIYDPRTDQWTSTARMTYGIPYPYAWLDPRGNVIVQDRYATYDLRLRAIHYDLARNVWEEWSAITGPPHAVIEVVNGGEVLLYDGGPYVKSVPGLPGVTGTLYDFSSIRLKDARILVAGRRESGAGQGTGLIYCAIYEPVSVRWSGDCAYTVPRAMPNLTLLRDGTVLMTGGFGTDKYVSEAERFDPRTLAWSSASRIPG